MNYSDNTQYLNLLKTESLKLILQINLNLDMHSSTYCDMLMLDSDPVDGSRNSDVASVLCVCVCV